MRIMLTAMVAATLMVGTAVAQMTSPAAKPTAGAVTIKATRVPVVRTAKSLDCSKQADAKGLHGKPRKSFMSSCKKAWRSSLEQAV